MSYLPCEGQSDVRGSVPIETLLLQESPMRHHGLNGVANARNVDVCMFLLLLLLFLLIVVFFRRATHNLFMLVNRHLKQSTMIELTEKQLEKVKLLPMICHKTAI